MPLRPRELENDPDNPCFGCGPRNPGGLRLRFFQAGDLVWAEKLFEDQFEEFPGVIHPGVIFASLGCATQWVAYARTGHVAPAIRSEFGWNNMARTGRPLRITGRVLKERRGRLIVRVEARQGRRSIMWRRAELQVVKDLKQYHRLAPDVKLTPVVRRIFAR